MADIGFGPLERIDGPLPLPPLFGLLQAAAAQASGVRFVDDVDPKGIERWLNGVSVYPYPGDDAQVYRACGVGTDRDEKGFGEDNPNPEFEPLTIWLAETCTAYKVWDQEEFKARARIALEAVEGAAVAKEFMEGAKLNAQPYLADGTGEFPNGDTATSTVDALALLEEQIALSGKQGIIHCSPMMASALMGRGFSLADKTGVIRTINGIVVVPDFGYAQANHDGSFPIGHAEPADRQEWAYATGPIDIRRTEVITLPGTVEEAMERGVAGASNGNPNSITYRVERYYLVDWDTEVKASVLVDRCRQDCDVD